MISAETSVRKETQPSARTDRREASAGINNSARYFFYLILFGQTWGALAIIIAAWDLSPPTPSSSGPIRSWKRTGSSRFSPGTRVGGGAWRGGRGARGAR